MANHIDKMYYDSFANEYVSVEDAEKEMGTAPPERFLLTLRGFFYYVEVYECYGRRLGIAYTEEAVKNGLVNKTRFYYAERNKFPIERATMIRWTIPADKFDKYADMFGIA